MEASQSTLERFQKELEKQLFPSIYPPPSDELIKTKSRKPVQSTNQNLQEIELHAQPSEGNIENVVNHEDGRKQVQNPSKWPNSVHGVVAAKFEGIEGTCFGTGTLIGPNIVLTAGHNLYNQTKKVYAQLESIQFLPGIDAQMLPFGIAEVEQYFVSPNYVKDNKEDYGILILKEPIGDMTGYFGLICPKLEEIAGKMINVTGYPRDKVKSKPKTYEMWEMEGPAAYIDKQKGLIQYPIDTAGGQSGSGVWYRDGEDYYVCGIHQGGNLSYNQATLLTKSIYQQIHTWLQKIRNKRLLSSRRSTRFELSKFELNKECLSFLIGENLNSLGTICFHLGMISSEGAAILAQNTSWVNLSRLDLSNNNIGDQGAAALARNTSWVNLSDLYLAKNNIGNQGAVALARNTSWVNLSYLHLSRNHIGNQGTAALARNTSWVSLSRLDFRKNNFDYEGAAELARNTSWVNLSDLDLSKNNIDYEGAVALARNTSWVNLSYLYLEENNIGNQGAAELAQNTFWVNLSRLDLSNNNIGNQGAAALARNTSWVNLSDLYLAKNNIGHQGAAEFAQNTSWVNLSYLDFRENNIGNQGAAALARNTSWVNLSYLHLNKNSIDSEGAAALARNTSWVNLSFLDLIGNNIGNHGAAALARNISWVNLSFLYLVKNNIGNQGAAELAQNTSWINLSDLYLCENNISNQGARALARNTSWVNLSYLDLRLNSIDNQGAARLHQNPSWKPFFKACIEN